MLLWGWPGMCFAACRQGIQSSAKSIAITSPFRQEWILLRLNRSYRLSVAKCGHLKRVSTFGLIYSFALAELPLSLHLAKCSIRFFHSIYERSRNCSLRRPPILQIACRVRCDATACFWRYLCPCLQSPAGQSDSRATPDDRSTFRVVQ